jgi:hypothetical protein
MTQFDKVVEVAKPFLGPATESFIARQCKAHLKIDATALAPTHMKDLAKWTQVGAGLIMDPSKATALALKISALV